MVELGTQMEKLREERREEGRLRLLLEEQVQLVHANSVHQRGLNSKRGPRSFYPLLSLAPRNI
jgi:hypothetical protein